MQHSRKKRVQQPLTEEERHKQEQRLCAIQNMHEAVLQAQQQASYTQESLDLTTKCITLSPDFYSVFNFRRRILQHLLTDQSEETKGEMLGKELDTLTKITRESPKSYTLWFHRQWVILRSRNFELLMKKELALCDKLLAMDQRNFHVWNYRTWLVKVAGSQTFEEELTFTTTLIYRDFSNYSAWHYRSKVVTGLYPKGLPQDFLTSELTTLKHAMYTCPADQSLWTYHQWLVAQVTPILVTSVVRTPTGVKVGFSHNVTGVGEEAVAVASGWRAVQGKWRTDSGNAYSYIWNYTVLDEAGDELELRTNADNTTLKDSSGYTQMAPQIIKLRSEGYDVEGAGEHELLTAEILSIEELLEIEDTHRVPAVLRLAQLYETQSFFALPQQRLNEVLRKIIGLYTELITRDAPRTPYYSENRVIAEARLSNTRLRTPKSERLAAQVLSLLS